MNNKKPNLLRSIGVGLAVLTVLFIYAFGFQVTKVDLSETKSENRREQLTRILRALAHPELFEFETEDSVTSLSIMIPCPEGGFQPDSPDTNGPYLVMTPACANGLETAVVEGFNFEPFSSGPLNLRPAESDVNLQLGSIKVDKDGYFEVEVRLSNRPNEKVQELHAITRQNVGSPKLTQAAHETWGKIVETVFLALLATTLGTILAIPLSFIAARNLMKDVKNSLIGMALSILFVPVGFYLGSKIAAWSSIVSTLFIENTYIAFAALLIAPAIIWPGSRFALFKQDEEQPLSTRFLRWMVIAVIALVAIIALYILSHLSMLAGNYLSEELGSFGFLGRFVRDLGDILGMVIGVIAALTGAGLLSSLAGRVGLRLNRKSGAFIRILQVGLSTAAGMLLFLLLAAMINWFYQFNNIMSFYTWATVIGGILGLILGITHNPERPMPTGLIIYFVSRTIFNATRSVEPLVMAIIFVVWVGIGPFAGSMALALHTIAALGKLYSEQVENIMAGPLEAVQATGANRLQTIIYAVIPQIIPPYISFTMYRWDINVRMSTIIGFAGGGGIGFLLNQNINMLNYRAASVQMLAIAVVVAAMDYISSNIRERFV
jgi:phosphonate ABC transporter permease subunit PhnE